MRGRLVDGIQQEIAHARAGRPAAIWVKLNSLVDPAMIDGLQRARSQAGVKIELVVRGICCSGGRAYPACPRISRSRVSLGRSREHGRIVCFGAGHVLPSLATLRSSMSSADWMLRNLDRRVEVLVPIGEPDCPSTGPRPGHEGCAAQRSGAKLAYESGRKLRTRSRMPRMLMPFPGAFDTISATNPSLSGRGRALKIQNSRQD